MPIYQSFGVDSGRAKVEKRTADVCWCNTHQRFRTSRRIQGMYTPGSYISKRDKCSGGWKICCSASWSGRSVSRRCCENSREQMHSYFLVCVHCWCWGDGSNKGPGVFPKAIVLVEFAEVDQRFLSFTGSFGRVRSRPRVPSSSQDSRTHCYNTDVQRCPQYTSLFSCSALNDNSFSSSQPQSKRTGSHHTAKGRGPGWRSRSHSLPRLFSGYYQHSNQLTNPTTSLVQHTLWNKTDPVSPCPRVTPALAARICISR